MTRFSVNDRPVEYRMDPETPLLWALRDASNLTGTKYGCGTGDCGACTVDIDGEAIRSCLVTIAECEGRFVTTIEALSRDRSHPVQQAWVAEQVPQCGFCQSGMIMAAAALLRSNSNPSDAEIDAAMTNICRCGTYPRIRAAIRLAGRVIRGEERIAACVVRADTRADVNTLVRKALDVRKASFLPVERAVEETGMAYGGITPVGLPEEWRLLVHEALLEEAVVVVGSGVRTSKLLLPGRLLADLPGAEVVPDLGR